MENTPIMTIKNNYTRANVVRIIFYAMMAMDIISAYSNILQLNLLKNAELSMMGVDMELADANDTRQQIVAIVHLLLIVATIVTFIMWYYRAYKNLHELKVASLHHTPGWAIGAWFVPFLNLGRPYTIMKEIWVNTQNFTVPKDELIRPSSSLIVGWWWGLWLFSNFLANITGRMTLRATTIEQLITCTQISIFSDAVDMVSVILTLIMLSRMVEYEKKLWDFVNDPMNSIGKAEIAN